MDYLKALERAILYIEHHLGEDIKVEDAAAAAGYSYYHFTRQFNALLGESVGSYIRKRRIAKAAKELRFRVCGKLQPGLQNAVSHQPGLLPEEPARFIHRFQTAAGGGTPHAHHKESDSPSCHRGTA